MLALFFVSFVACGGKDGNPAAPTAGPSPAPTPIVQATATPPPVTNPALPQSCRGLASSGVRARGVSACARGTPNFLSQMRDAVNLAVGSTYRDPQTGETFDVVRGNKIQVAGAYLKIIADTLDRQGICAVYDGEEMNVRDGGGYNENYDIISADGGWWVNYNVTCSPAQSIPPLPPTPPVRDAECRNLPPSALTFCVKDSSTYDGDVWDAQDILIAEDRARATPQVFNFNDRFSSGAPYGYKIINEQLYISELLKKIKAKGYCAFYDGDEFVVKRNNVASEHFDMIKSDLYALRVHNSTCRDAAF
jgi:hypothetical protein